VDDEASLLAIFPFRTMLAGCPHGQHATLSRCQHLGHHMLKASGQFLRCSQAIVLPSNLVLARHNGTPLPSSTHCFFFFSFAVLIFWDARASLSSPLCPASDFSHFLLFFVSYFVLPDHVAQSVATLPHYILFWFVFSRCCLALLCSSPTSLVG